MTSQDIATLALLRWNELRKQGVAPKDRWNDPDLQRYERELAAVKRAMERKS